MIVITTESSQFIDSNRTAGVQYYYRIKANGPNGPGSFSEPGERVAMGIPVITQAVQEGNNAIRISWSAVPGSSGYLLYRGTSQTSGFEPVTDTTGITYLDTGLTRYSAYYYVVRAYQGNGYSGYSNCAEVVLQGQ